MLMDGEMVYDFIYIIGENMSSIFVFDFSYYFFDNYMCDLEGVEVYFFYSLYYIFDVFFDI